MGFRPQCGRLCILPVRWPCGSALRFVGDVGKVVYDLVFQFGTYNILWIEGGLVRWDTIR